MAQGHQRANPKAAQINTSRPTFMNISRVIQHVSKSQLDMTTGLLGCVELKHRGYTLSLSNILGAGELRIFKGTDDVTGLVLREHACGSAPLPTAANVALVVTALDAL